VTFSWTEVHLIYFQFQLKSMRIILSKIGKANFSTFVR